MGPHQIVRGLRAILLEDLHEQRVDTRVIAEELYIQQQHWLQTRKALEKKDCPRYVSLSKRGQIPT
jgi:hypothetical protein